MGLFGFLKKEENENENKSKPFHQNETNAERKDWFSRTRPWHKVDAAIIDVLIKKYNDDPMFEVFVVTSMENSLVNEYEELGLKDIDAEVACSVISGILFKHGANYSAQVGDMLRSGKINERKLSKNYQNAMNLLESSINVDPNQISGYVQLAGLRSMLNKNDDALKFVNRGLEAIKRLKESNVPFHESNISSVQNASQSIEETEQMLLTMKSDLS